MAEYTKAPVTIEAVQFNGMENSAEFIFDCGKDAPDWLKEAFDKGRAVGGMWEQGPSADDPLGQSLRIGTLEGTHRADPGDFIIRGIKGELYPCKPDIFAESYYPAGLLKPAGTFREDLASCINRWSIENDSNTPDFLLADFVIDSMGALARAVEKREEWYGRSPRVIVPKGIDVSKYPLEPGKVIWRHPWVEPSDRGEPQPEPDALTIGEGSETIEDLLYDLGNLLRGYEGHHLGNAEMLGNDPQRRLIAQEKANRNATYAARVERKLRELYDCGSAYTDGVRDLASMSHVSPQVADVLRDCASLIDGMTLAEAAPLGLLADAVKGCGLIESGTGWVKVHALANPAPLFNLLTAAKIAGERA